MKGHDLAGLSSATTSPELGLVRFRLSYLSPLSYPVIQSSNRSLVCYFGSWAADWIAPACLPPRRDKTEFGEKSPTSKQLSILARVGKLKLRLTPTPSDLNRRRGASEGFHSGNGFSFHSHSHRPCKSSLAEISSPFRIGSARANMLVVGFAEAGLGAAEVS
ncbi:hypothetical protein M501DRAFT_1021117 [Patellaria atrata CBS 101060]|uniref:Uncharacterized protein n=1 Tax=Patellaria atrata CBS 101060 TaxID=1346257 RepID=A0A9P4S2V6_9PEZI|nr:hypothetical protein M501DRAFT_1021117 [Patellaria atrata CBS 101060]